MITLSFVICVLGDSWHIRPHFPVLALARMDSSSRSFADDFPLLFRYLPTLSTEMLIKLGFLCLSPQGTSNIIYHSVSLNTNGVCRQYYIRLCAAIYVDIVPDRRPGFVREKSCLSRSTSPDTWPRRLGSEFEKGEHHPHQSREYFVFLVLYRSEDLQEEQALSPAMPRRGHDLFWIWEVVYVSSSAVERPFSSIEDLSLRLV